VSRLRYPCVLVLFIANLDATVFATALLLVVT
jgi:hypothetical protein